MKNKLAIWSWILPATSLLIVILVFWIMEEFSLISIPQEVLAALCLSVLVLSGLGIYYGIIALKEISKNSQLRGKTQAVIGIILSLPIFIMSGLYLLFLWAWGKAF